MEKTLKQQPCNCIKVVLFGPESTGKTTLSKQLADHYNTAWVPEYAREYLQKKYDSNKESCQLEDLLPIAYGQIALENKQAQKANKILVCDTNLLETKVYAQIYFGSKSIPLLNKYALKNTYDLYFLTYIDVPWESDDLRDKPNERETLFELFKSTLTHYGHPFVELRGSKEKRLKKAIKHINVLLKSEIDK